MTRNFCISVIFNTQTFVNVCSFTLWTLKWSLFFCCFDILLTQMLKNKFEVLTVSTREYNCKNLWKLEYFLFVVLTFLAYNRPKKIVVFTFSTLDRSNYNIWEWIYLLWQLKDNAFGWSSDIFDILMIGSSNDWSVKIKLWQMLTVSTFELLKIFAETWDRQKTKNIWSVDVLDSLMIFLYCAVFSFSTLK